MHMIRDAADTVAFTFSVSRDRGEIGMERRADGGIKNRRAVFGAEDNVNEKE
jgi:hypothetical protein